MTSFDNCKSPSNNGNYSLMNAARKISVIRRLEKQTYKGWELGNVSAFSKRGAGVKKEETYGLKDKKVVNEIIDSVADMKGIRIKENVLEIYKNGEFVSTYLNGVAKNEEEVLIKKFL